MKMKRYMLMLFTTFMFCATLFAIRSLGDNSVAVVETFSKAEGVGDTITFSENDFNIKAKEGNILDAIVISETPQSGTLKLSEQVLEFGDVVDFGLIEEMSFTAEKTGEISDEFSFIPVFSKTGAASKSVSVSLKLSDRINNTPVAVNCEYETFSGIKLTGILKSVDADDDKCTYYLASKPKKGDVIIEENRFVYTPKNGKSGTDSFEFYVEDESNSRSNTAKVKITINKAPSKDIFSYSDMENSRAHYAALYLRKEGIMEGETFGNESFFYPEKEVTRAQFVTLISTVSNLSMPTVSIGTGLSDNESIPTWARPYVAAAINGGIIEGTSDGGANKVFRADESLTRAEAAAILDRAMNLAKDERKLTCEDINEVPAWAEQSIVNTTAAGIMSVFDDNTVRASQNVTREDAALMLYEAVKYLEEKDSSVSFWEKLFG